MKKTIMATIVTMTLSGNAMAYDTVLADRINPETGVISNGVVWEQNVDLVTEKELTQKLSELPVGNVGNIGSGSFAGQSDNNFDVDMGDVAGNVGNICSGTATGNAVITCDIEIENANIENANVSFDDLTEAQKESLQGADGTDGKDGVVDYEVVDGMIDDADLATNSDLEKLKDRIEEVNVEDQRVESGKLDSDGNLVLTNADMDGGSKNDVTIDLSGLDQSEEVESLKGKVDAWVDTDTVRSDEDLDETFATDADVTEVKNELANQDSRLDTVETGVDQAHDRIDAIQDTLYDEGVIRAESDKVLAEGIEIAREESANGDAYLQEQVDNKVDQSEYEADQARQDQALADSVADSVARDEELQAGVDANTDAIEKTNDRITDVVAEQAKTDAAQDVVISDLNGKVDVNQNEMFEHVDTVKNEINETITQVNNNVDRVENESIARDEEIKSQLDNTVDVWVDENGKGYGATLTDEKGNTVNVASYDDVAANRETINNTHNQINGEGGLVGQIDANAAKNEVQDVKINDNSQAISDNRGNIVNNTAAIRKEEQSRKEADAEIIKEQAKVDALQDAASVAYRNSNDDRVSLVEEELYSTTARSKDNSKRLDKVETEIAGIHNELNTVKKGVAMSAALGFGSNLHTKNHNGNWTVTPSIAHYEGNTALAITAQVSVTDDMALRVGYSNVANDLLDIDKGIVGAAVTFSFD